MDPIYIKAFICALIILFPFFIFLVFLKLFIRWVARIFAKEFLKEYYSQEHILLTKKLTSK